MTTTENGEASTAILIPAAPYDENARATTVRIPRDKDAAQHVLGAFVGGTAIPVSYGYMGEPGNVGILYYINDSILPDRRPPGSPRKTSLNYRDFFTHPSLILGSRDGDGDVVDFPAGLQWLLVEPGQPWMDMFARVHQRSSW